jgi:hypothetical protein
LSNDAPVCIESSYPSGLAHHNLGRFHGGWGSENVGNLDFFTRGEIHARIHSLQEAGTYMELFRQGFLSILEAQRRQFRLLHHILRNLGEGSSDVGFRDPIRNHCRSRIGIQRRPGGLVKLAGYRQLTSFLET